MEKKYPWQNWKPDDETKQLSSQSMQTQSWQNWKPNITAPLPKPLKELSSKSPLEVIKGTKAYQEIAAKQITTPSFMKPLLNTAPKKELPSPTFHPAQQKVYEENGEVVPNKHVDTYNPIRGILSSYNHEDYKTAKDNPGYFNMSGDQKKKADKYLNAMRKAWQLVDTGKIKLEDLPEYMRNDIISGKNADKKLNDDRIQQDKEYQEGIKNPVGKFLERTSRVASNTFLGSDYNYVSPANGKADVVSDIAGTIIGYGTNVPGAGTSQLGIANNMVGAPTEAFVSKATSKLGNKALRTVLPMSARGAAEGASLAGIQGYQQGKDIKEIGKDMLIQGTAGAILDPLAIGGLSRVGKALKRPAKETAINAEKTVKNITAPKMYKGKLPQVEIDLIAEKAKSWVDKPQKLAYKRETLDRNLMDIIPDKKEAKQVIDTFIEPIRKNEAENIRNINTYRETVKKLDIKPFSKESALVQKYGEGLIDLEQLKKETPNYQKIVDAAAYFRKTYDELLTKANEVLKANGYKEIARRPNYFPHMGELQTVMQKIGIENPELPTDINGLTDMFVPGKNFFANALQRKGDKTAYDAIRGFDGYIEGINKIIHHTGDIQRIRQLEKTLRKSFEGTNHLSNFVAELREYGNLLAGKQSKLDRGAEEFVGRQVYKVADTIRKQVGANMVGANVSSALTNFIPLTQAMGSTRPDVFIKAMAQTIGNVFKNDGFIDKSDYLVRRMGSDRLALTNWQKVGKGANWLFKIIDNFTAQTITRAKYLEGIKQGLDESEALKVANNYAGKLMADRSIGMTPTLFSSKTLAPFNMFQIEVNNQLSFLFKDLPREFTKNKAALASAYGQIAIYSYLFNNLYEKATGRRPAFDILGVAQQAYEDYNNDNLDTGSANKKTIQNIANQLPFTSAITGGRIPLSNALPDFMGIASGEKEPKKELLKPVFNLLPPAGGSQINKTIQGLSTFNEGGTYNNNKTQMKYPVEKNTSNLVKGALLGPSAFPETKDYYDNNRKQLSEKQTELVKNANDPGVTYKDVLQQRKVDSLKLKISAVKKDKTLTSEERQKQLTKLQEQLKEALKK